MKEKLAMKEEKIKKIVREGYAKAAKKQGSCCCGSAISEKIGYTKEDLKSIPEGTASFGCGNPTAFASLKEGDTVLDLGSGAGFDCFLAARKVGDKGKVIGVDMTPEMIDKAREIAREGNYKNVEFRLSEIEHLPVADKSVDVIISNCVINLSPNKKSVFKEAFRVLKPSGRLMVSDIVLLKDLPKEVKNSTHAYIGCVSGAMMKDDYVKTIRGAGFQGVRIIDERHFPSECILDDPYAKAIMRNSSISEEMRELASSIVSITVYGVKQE